MLSPQEFDHTLFVSALVSVGIGTFHLAMFLWSLSNQTKQELEVSQRLKFLERTLADLANESKERFLFSCGLESKFDEIELFEDGHPLDQLEGIKQQITALKTISQAHHEHLVKQDLNLAVSLENYQTNLKDTTTKLNNLDNLNRLNNNKLAHLETNILNLNKNQKELTQGQQSQIEILSTYSRQQEERLNKTTQRLNISLTQLESSNRATQQYQNNGNAILSSVGNKIFELSKVIKQNPSQKPIEPEVIKEYLTEILTTKHPANKYLKKAFNQLSKQNIKYHQLTNDQFLLFKELATNTLQKADEAINKGKEVLDKIEFEQRVEQAANKPSISRIKA